MDSDEKILITRNVEVRLTAAELKAKGKELAERELELQSAEEAKRSDAAAHREKVKAIKKAIAELAGEVDSGFVNRDVQCEKRPNHHQGCWEIVRLDTGAVLDTEVMSADDRQESLHLV